MLILVVRSVIGNHLSIRITLRISLEEKYYQDEILYYRNPRPQPNPSAKLIHDQTNS